ncbi:hypothetical protein F383_22323 [Gossypium arboreum]|uniref:Uncharacterized protein n=1 Tax=Gossypium arboreum TaxID=29729 RepID=A0A0B0MZ68_GOSAR|nr:hypothetical protein F383_34735 [Gossypium arboreum]KHG17618.1 hypothetical protein F383_22323 [Gossypium arboreum]
MLPLPNQLLYEDPHSSNQDHYLQDQDTATLRDSQGYEELLPEIVHQRGCERGAAKCSWLT